ncbi:hypothetical protein O6H91_12G038700 [Diphasiastrum complanatum]|uniref:Uncharacterized protein n=2 Tax=Diphasiastrum complanatum TaxID=34168 RepID=A0ACC2C0I2_DIPCM|nr:hypothetical protein O6H91_12G038700 [Diphasiastrum complanatum]KAJ7535559.1 hypothetical protein O6H91_12G038700 [Diphasiastrum complanatum]
MADQDLLIKEPLMSREEPEHLKSATKTNNRLWPETGKQLTIALPMICVNLLWFSLNVVSVMFVGHLGTLALASASLANSIANVTGSSFLLGMASALETLCGQAYGAKQYHMLGIFLQRSILVLNVISLPIAVLWWNMGYVLRALGQNPEISVVAGEYARWMIPTLFAYAFTQPLIKFLQAQSVVLPMTLISLTTLLLHITLCWLMIFKLGFGYIGAAIALGISNWLNVALLAAYVKFSPLCKKTWTSFSREAYRDLEGFFKLAIPSAVMLCLEIWSFEVLVILSGLLPDPQLQTSTLTICLTNLVLMYMVPFGLSAAVSTRVSNELGAGHPQAAKFAVTVNVVMAVLEGALMATLLMSVLRKVDGWAFSNDARVVNYVSSCMPLLAAIVFMDSIQGVLSGVARGCGWQDFGAYTNLGSFYIVGLPLAIILAFIFHFNDLGLWIGMIVGMAVKTITLCLITLFTDWDKQAMKAMGRIDSSATTNLPIQTNDSQKEDLLVC